MHPDLGLQLQVLKQFQQQRAVIESEEDLDLVPLWPFKIKDFLREWRLAVKEADLGAWLKTPYEDRHSGASRDLLLELRSRDGVQARGHWDSNASLRNYDKAARMQKIASDMGDTVLLRGEDTKKNFAKLFRAGTHRNQLGNLSKLAAATRQDYHL